MKNPDLFPVLLILLLAACGPAPAAPAALTPVTLPPTAAFTPSSTPAPTASPTLVEPNLTPTVQHAEIDPYSSSTTWSADVQAQFKDVLTDPWTATADEKAAYDTFLTTQWQLTLKADGVANTETLQGYDLLNAIIEHQPPVVLTGNETSEQLASYVVELPFSLQKLIITDQNNLVGWHHEAGRYVEGQILANPNGVVIPQEFQGPVQKTPYDLGYFDANYGFGATTSPKPDNAELLKDMGYLSSTTYPDNYGFDFYGEKIPAIGVWAAPEGDLMFLFRIPGTDPNTAVGAMLRMYDGSRVAYTEAYLPLSNAVTTANDTCLTLVQFVRMQTRPCQAGISISDLNMEDPLLTGSGRGSLYSLLKLMNLYNNNPHIEFTLLTRMAKINGLWKDGIPVLNTMSIPNIPKDFFTKP